MKSKFIIPFYLIVILGLQSCHNKRYTEIVEVPLPTAQEKKTIGNPDDVKANAGTFSMIKLPYMYDALQPNIGALTLENHYSKHYLTYTNNLNKVIAGTPMESLSIEEILDKLDLNNETLRNNAGGYYNHNLYWENMGAKTPQQPKDTLAGAIKKDFGSFENFTSMFKDTAEKEFGSGWAWLVVDKAGKLQITSTQNQDNPLMPKAVIKGTPLLAIDLWEHAYYLDYQYKRKNYIDGFFNVINWNIVDKRYEDYLKK